ncbi:MAG: NAD kinase [Cellulomonadaceae bacterium]|jgi:NAD+ kinase|nr:NAD kinase [Cellulomonadaceae bacterium]
MTTRKVLIVTHGGNPAAVAALDDAVAELTSAGFTPHLHNDDDARSFGDKATVDHIHANVSDAELVMVLGGDGSILRAAELTYGTQVPILGVNLGHVGFLAESERKNLHAVVGRIAAHDYTVEERTVAHVTVRRPVGHMGDGQVFEEITDWALNEATIEKDVRQRLIEVGIEVDERPLSSFGCDGVIVATSTGSTAHAFSAGGPIMWPNLEGLLLVPLAAHALFARPLVIGPTSTFRVTVLDRSPLPAVLACDGRRTIDLPVGSVVDVRIGPRPLRFARLSAAPFTDRLVSKFSLPVIGWREAAETAQAAAATGRGG